MPTYEYRCPKGHSFEVFQRMTDPDPDGCEVCGAAPVERVLFAPAIHFKGSGFYSTDYGRGKKKKDGKDGEASTSTSSSASESSAPEKKTEKKAAEAS
jgi:putative FmdB family regulatory protein